MLNRFCVLLACLGLTGPAGCTDFNTAQAADAGRTGQEETTNTLPVTVRLNGREFILKLHDTPAAREFAARLPMDIAMRDLNGNEKYHYLSRPLKTRPQRPGKIRAGELMLYGDDCLVLFYQSFATSYAYTPLGRVENPAGLAQAAGNGGATVQFSALESKK